MTELGQHSPWTIPSYVGGADCIPDIGVRDPRKNPLRFVGKDTFLEKWAE